MTIQKIDPKDLEEIAGGDGGIGGTIDPGNGYGTVDPGNNSGTIDPGNNSGIIGA